MHDGTHSLGHNQGPPFDQEQIDKLAAEIATFTDTAGKWLDKKEIASEDDAARLNDFIAGCRKKWKAIDAARADAKKPHDEAAKAVQAAFKPLLDKMETAAKKVQPLLTAWLEAQEAKRCEEAREAEEQARKAREEAERLAAQAEARNDVSGAVDAEAAREAAEAAQKDAERMAKARANVSSATGGGRTASLRTYYEARITNINVAFMAFKDEPEVAAVLTTLAERRARSKDFDAKRDKIPGFEITASRRAV